MGSEYVSNDLMGDEGSFLKSEEARNQGGPAIPETVIGTDLELLLLGHELSQP
jgi:hypothetical protein